MEDLKKKQELVPVACNYKGKKRPLKSLWLPYPRFGLSQSQLLIQITTEEPQHPYGVSHKLYPLSTSAFLYITFLKAEKTNS